tara:strand:- start:650 stop:1585 length:936 start_codon:yes stop_codon:yes gene_type:complete
MAIGDQGQWSNWRTLCYPAPNSLEANSNVPLWLQMTAVPYEQKTQMRDNAADPGSSNNYATVSLPLPVEITNANSANYASGTVFGRGGLFDVTNAMIAEGRSTSAGVSKIVADYMDTGVEGALENVPTALIEALAKSAKDAFGFQNREMPMDLRDQVFSGVNFRNFTYSWQLIPKTVDDAFRVATICNAFQTLLYPIRNVENNFGASRVLHPPMWFISTFDYSGGGPKNRWTMYPQICLLQSVSVQPRTGAGSPWVLGSGDGPWPAITNLSVNFVELEPNINVGNRIANRSKVLNNVGNNGFYGGNLGGDL